MRKQKDHEPWSGAVDEGSVWTVSVAGLVLRAIWSDGGRMQPWRAGEVEEVFCRSGGPGGQHVNKVSTAVTLRHVATGIVVRVSASRSQARNRAEATRLLAEKLESAAAAARQSRLAEVSKSRRRRAKRSRATKRRLVESKRRRGETKQFRKKVS
jgi:protein subunit release factor B